MSIPVPKFVYFGGEPIGVPVLEELKACGQLPELVVCNPDRPSGRGQKLTPPPVKVWAEANNIAVWQPEDLKDQAAITQQLQAFELFVVVAYNRIMPEWLLKVPEHGCINLHPSLLPLRRGPNPIRSAIKEDDRASIGVSVMLLDAEMDHGPLLDQAALPIADEYWPLPGPELDLALARLGGATLATVIPEYVADAITPQEQDHTLATYTNKVARADGELNLDPHALPTGPAAWEAWLTINAYAGWPGTFFIHEGKRIKITKAEYANDTLRLVSVIPEGKAEMDFSTWLQR